MAYTLPPLPYSIDGLEPFCDKVTLEIHHGKHHAAYVDKLNEALINHPGLSEKTVEELISDLESVPAEIRTAVANHGGGHANHSLFWQIMKPKGESTPFGGLVEAITSDFGSVTNFKEKFSDMAVGLFGCGWTWLSVEMLGRLNLSFTQNQDSPLSQGEKPILALDLWEHAYYLKFQNRRSEWIDSWWNVVNWDEVSALYMRIVSGATLQEVYAEGSLAPTSKPWRGEL